MKSSWVQSLSCYLFRMMVEEWNDRKKSGNAQKSHICISIEGGDANGNLRNATVLFTVHALLFELLFDTVDFHNKLGIRLIIQSLGIIAVELHGSHLRYDIFILIWIHITYRRQFWPQWLWLSLAVVYLIILSMATISPNNISKSWRWLISFYSLRKLFALCESTLCPHTPHKI